MSSFVANSNVAIFQIRLNQYTGLPCESRGLQRILKKEVIFSLPCVRSAGLEAQRGGYAFSSSVKRLW
jgi:hypothetical protein